MPDVVGGDSRLNLSLLNETANLCTYQAANSFVWFKRSRLIAPGNKKARMLNSSLFIYGWRNSYQFSKGINIFLLALTP